MHQSFAFTLTKDPLHVLDNFKEMSLERLAFKRYDYKCSKRSKNLL